MDSLQDILGTRNFTPPDEITSIKNYVLRRYKSTCGVRLERDALILSVPTSGLAATIQLERQSLIKSCGLTKRLVIRTGR